MTYEFVSVSSSPGLTGTFFYTKAFDLKNYPGVYSAKYCSSEEDFYNVLHSKRYVGVSVSMPYKQVAVRGARSLDETARFAQSANTLVLENGGYRAFSSDYFAAAWVVDNLVKGHVSILGNGAMGKIFSRLLELKSVDYTIYSRSLGNWDLRHKPVDTLINCTSVGTSSSGSPIDFVSPNCTIIDLALKPTLLSKIASRSGSTYIAGIDFYTRVFRRQFEYYTSIVMSESEIESIKTSWISQNV